MRVRRAACATAALLLVGLLGCVPNPDGPPSACEPATVRGAVDLAKFPDVFYVQAIVMPNGGSTSVWANLNPDGTFELTIPAHYEDELTPEYGWDLPAELAINGVSSELFMNRWSQRFNAACGATVEGIQVDQEVGWP